MSTEVATHLRRPGIEPWMDCKLKLAGRWNIEIDDRISANNLLLLISGQDNGDAGRETKTGKRKRD